MRRIPDLLEETEKEMAEKQAFESEAADILVVDDNIPSLRRLAEILSQEGYRVEQADRPEAALQAVRAQPPSLILLDLSLPGMSGFEVCRRLKQDERTRGVPVIFMSASQAVEDRVQGFEVGGVDFVSTPCHESEMLARVRTHLQLRRTQLHLEELVAQRTAESRARNEALKEEVQARKRAQQALRDDENKYRAVVEGARAGILVMQDAQRVY